MLRSSSAIIFSFNTQPPEGGWREGLHNMANLQGFNTQPPEGGWAISAHSLSAWARFQHTAARRRLVLFAFMLAVCRYVSTHSRPKAAGDYDLDCDLADFVSTHSRPKAAGLLCHNQQSQPLGFNTQPPEGGWFKG